MRYVIVAVLAVCAIGIALRELSNTTADLTIREERVGTIPITIFEPRRAEAAPVVVVAHGFTGSRQLMLPFAVTLARNGYVAVTFDFPGHGRNDVPLPGGLAAHEERSRALVEALSQVAAFAGRLPRADGRLAVLGHSMGADIAVRHALAHPDVAATVAVSLFSRSVTADAPRNLLVIDGALEPARLREEGLRIVGMAAGAPAEAGVTYGSFAAGTARRLALAEGVEHIGVLYSRDSLREATRWLDESFRRSSTAVLDRRGPWLGLLFLGLVALAWPLARLLPRVAAAPLGASAPWRRLLPAALAPALLAPLILWQIDTDILPILLADYLAVHFGLYGLLTAAGLWFGGRQYARAGSKPVSAAAFVVAALGATGYATLALGLPIDAYVASFVPAGSRLLLVFALLAGTLPYFVADEWLTRGPDAPRGAYVVTKILFLLSLVLAVALNLQKLFFLAIIVPAILAFFVVYGLFSRWIYARTRHPLVAAVANAVAFAWAMAATFPIVAR